jgi:hypothetical protein
MLVKSMFRRPSLQGDSEFVSAVKRFKLFVCDRNQAAFCAMRSRRICSLMQ